MPSWSLIILVSALLWALAAFAFGMAFGLGSELMFHLLQVT